MKKLVFVWLKLFGIVGVFLMAGRSAPAEDRTEPWLPVGDLHALLRGEIPDLRPPAPGETNARAYLESLAPLVLVDGDPPASGPMVSKTNIYDAGIGYLRINRVDGGMAKALSDGLSALSRRNPLTGLVLDLRFAGGRDFNEAANASSLLASAATRELRLGDQHLKIEPRGVSNLPPVVLLVNRRTRGAAEGFAAAVRAVAAPSLVLGTNTAGEARMYRDLSVPGGRHLRVAGAPLTLPGGEVFPQQGLAPDLGVPIPEADEELYFADEFRRVVEGRRVTSNNSLRMNEAELVRRRRGPLEAEELGAPRGSLEPGFPRGTGRRGQRSGGQTDESEGSRAVQDPVLARSIDLLAALASERASGSAGSAGEAGDSR